MKSKAAQPEGSTGATPPRWSGTWGPTYQAPSTLDGLPSGRPWARALPRGEDCAPGTVITVVTLGPEVLDQLEVALCLCWQAPKIRALFPVAASISHIHS